MHIHIYTTLLYEANLLFSQEMIPEGYRNPNETTNNNPAQDVNVCSARVIRPVRPRLSESVIFFVAFLVANMQEGSVIHSKYGEEVCFGYHGE